MYFLVCLVGALLTSGFATVFIILRYFTTCCCKPNSCTCLRCGTPWPTLKQTVCGGGLAPQADGRVTYGRCSRISAFLSVGTTVLAIAACILVGEFLGNQGLSNIKMDTALRGGAHFMNSMRTAIGTLNDVLVDTSDEALGPMLANLSTVRDGCGLLEISRANIMVVNTQAVLTAIAVNHTL